MATIRIVAATKPIQNSVSIWSVPGEWDDKARPFYSRKAARRPPGHSSVPSWAIATERNSRAIGADLYSRLLMRRRPRPSNALRLAVRAGALGAAGAAVAVPLLRRRLRIPTAV